MLSLTHLQSLVTALDLGSISAAARALGLSQPAVSQHLAQLESQLGTALVERRPRGVQPSPAGRIAAEHGRRMLAELDSMGQALDELRGAITGRFRITTTQVIARTLMLPVLTQLQLDYPDLAVELIGTDSLLDLAADEIDLALRFGTPGEGPGQVRKIAELNAVLVAAPGYLDRAGRPDTPADLAGLNFVEYGASPGATALTLRRGAELVSAPVQPAFAAKDPNLVLHAVETGLGFATAPLFIVARQIADGYLERLLPDYETEPRALYLVQPEPARDSRRNRAVRATIFAALARTEGVRLAASARAELALPA